MEREQVIARIRQVAPEAEIMVEGADCDFTAVVLSEAFDGVSQVKRQQQVLAQFSNELASGELHALTVRAHTPGEWQVRQAQTLTTISL